MKKAAYEQYSEQLRQKLTADPRVLGLVALGSMAQQDYQPDEWSDHDFFVITIHGVQEDMRQDLSWLPRAEEIIFHFKETEHGMKVLYADGHLLEFAILNEDELQVARLNRYRVLLDKVELTSNLAELMLSTEDFVAQSRRSPNHCFAELLMNILVGVGRHARGEYLSGRQFIKTYALSHLLKFLREHDSAENVQLLDNLDLLRRFELVFPGLGAEVNEILEKESLTAAEELLAMAVREFRPFLVEFPEAAVVQVQQAIVRAKQAEGEDL
ncbi:hypothetical protein MNBD_CHLOROFLEXI01-2550 [hydrothermal vent metagenome]|uniref:Uncharacterized protein n=1 Tax=hydrothermal vent metagenome TaxID=652676 RepID=A0A3B0VWZ8_9ZZZZ